VTDADGDRAVVRRGQIAVHQIRDDAALSGQEYLTRDLRAGRERGAGQVDPGTAARRSELELARRVGQHDESAFRLRHLQRRVDHQRQHLLEHPSRSERAQAVEDRRHLLEIGCIRGGAAQAGRGLALPDLEDEFHRFSSAQPDPVAVGQRALGHLLAVDERAVTGAAVAQQEDLALFRDFGVFARDVGTCQLQIGRRPPADREDRLAERNDAAALRIGDLKTRVAHGVFCQSGVIDSTAAAALDGRRRF